MAVWQLFRNRTAGGQTRLARFVVALTVMLCVIGIGLGGRATPSLALFGLQSNAEETESDSEAKSVEQVRARPRVCRETLVTHLPTPPRDMAAHRQSILPSAPALQAPLHLIGSGIRMLC